MNPENTTTEERDGEVASPVHVWTHAVRHESEKYINTFVAIVQKYATASQEEIEKAVIRAIKDVNYAYEDMTNAESVADSQDAFIQLVRAIAKTDALFKIAAVRGWL